MEKLSTREWYNRVTDHLIIGALPFKSMAQLLVDEEVVFFIENTKAVFLFSSSGHSFRPITKPTTFWRNVTFTIMSDLGCLMTVHKVNTD